MLQAYHGEETCLFSRGAKEDFGGQHVFVTGPSELLERVAHLDLTLAAGIALGSVLY